MRIGMMALPGTASPEDLRSLGVSSLRVQFRTLLSDGTPDPAGVDEFRALWAPCVQAGFQLHGISPFPSDLPGGDPTEASWSLAWRRAGAGIAEALGDLVGSWQIGNELNIWQFRAPMRTLPAAARFVADVADGLRQGSHDVRLGINAFGVGESTAELYGYVYGPGAALSLDYVGVDAYPGCWEDGGPESWHTIIDRVWSLGGGRPVVVCEIGFPSRGDIAVPGELDAYLRRLGYRHLSEVEADRDRLLAASPGPLAAAFAKLPTESWAEDFEDSAGHLLKKWRRSWGGGAHTPEKQARYFSEALEFLLVDPRIEELILFMFQDPPVCWSCGQPDCPLETSWGFVDLDGRRKPVFGAVETMVHRLGIVAGPSRQVG
ncbi:MAG: hypothetical protein M3082_10240 [Candidatus Dormibacteraeota bacterium]|nr:hypothetical protein [Candidatus Dormibacteraeota bacterium]